MSAATAVIPKVVIPKVVILGAGFGGLELSSRLSEELGADVDVTLIDKHDSFVFGFSKLDVMFGKRKLDEVRSYYRDIAKPGVEFRQETVQSIDPNAKRVVTDQGTYDADILVVALGADYDVSATPGLAEGGHEFYSVAGADRLRDFLPTFSAGVAVIAVLGPFFKCPAAPFEAAFMLHEMLEERGIRDDVTMYVLSSLPAPVPISEEISGAIVGALAERDIELWPSSRVTSIDPNTHVATIEDGRTLAFDLLLGVPVHVAPPVVVEGGLTEADGWIAVDPATMATKFAGVYALGDVTSMPVPRTGVMAEGEARTLADVLLAQLSDGAPPPPFDGVATCYLEWGDGLVARVNVEFLGDTPPHGSFTPPSAAITAEKAEFGATRRRRWFGSD
ncbi:MAG: NAD(P)/FAD-dependent oxidoreductase [Acidimicrobiia bacterium]|nr:NAD(P)/FAD-dependent oxidoreductase [Acidimicrobiia bacterium]